ncbi:uncharacterized protein [Nicotiana sylvestris]|uniref:uncharacterized protein n=1 Tax=Nicotiana sylvestris TaxID=4096 RepID=UPI00388CC2A9
MKDQLIDATAEHELLSFLDAYPGYNQIKMDPTDEEKTSFITDRGTYCDKVMPFGLKNAGDHISHLSDTFKILRKFNMKLNPEKCAVGVASGRLAKWAIELSEYDITYQPRTTIKSQVLANFVADFSQGMQLEAEKELQVFNESNPGIWTLFTDGSSNVKGADLGIILVPPTGETIRQAIKCHSITNNETEYEAVIAGLELARELGINQIVIKSDSKLVVNQMLGTYTAREARMQQYLEKYGTVPKDKKKAHVLRKKAAQYCLKQGNLYRKMFGGPLARCLEPSQTEYVMREIHEGHCGNHAGRRSLVRTMIRPGHYWLKMEEEAENFVAKYDKCQRYGNNMHRPAELLHSVIAPWPFMKWGMDIVGPLPQAKG